MKNIFASISLVGFLATGCASKPPVAQTTTHTQTTTDQPDGSHTKTDVETQKTEEPNGTEVIKTNTSTKTVTPPPTPAP